MNIPGFTIVGSTKIENRDYFPMGPVKIGLIPLFDTPRVVVSWGRKISFEHVSAKMAVIAQPSCYNDHYTMT